MKPVIIQQKIFEIRGEKVMLDFDLAKLYGVETRIFNQAIKRNKDSFPGDFMFRLTAREWKQISSQIVMSSKQIESGNSSQIVTSSRKHRGKTYLPYAFTEHGVGMAASVLKSPKARKMNIAIVRAFVALKRFALQHKDLIVQLDELRKELYGRLNEHDIQLTAIYDAIEDLLDEKVEKKKWEERERIGFNKKDQE